MAAAIEFRQVNKWFGKLHVLSDVTLGVAPAEVVVVCGPSGSGKSTLIRCVNALERIQGGDIVVLDESITSTHVNLTRLRTQVGMVFQSFNLFPHMTALENIMLAPMKVRNVPREDAEKTARALLARVGIPDKAQAYPAQLSQGEAQRAALARAIVKSPALLLADEPTGNLDEEMAGEILDLIKDIWSRGTTVLLATHQARLAAQLRRRTVRLEGGVLTKDEG